MTSAKPVDVAIGIVIRDGQTLICRRTAASTFAGYWEFPGGKCESGESPADCARRELLEELAIHVTPLQVLPVIEHRYDHVHVRLHPFICRLDAGEPRPLSASECRWIPLADLTSYQFPEANAPLLSDLAACYNSPSIQE